MSVCACWSNVWGQQKYNQLYCPCFKLDQHMSYSINMDWIA